MVDAARQWTVLKLASMLLGEGIEKAAWSRHRSGAGARRPEFPDIDPRVPSSACPSGRGDDSANLWQSAAAARRSVCPCMSDGTVDQLHLALRIAYLADYCGRQRTRPVHLFGRTTSLPGPSTMPRTAAAIEALGASSELFQPIVFTHHTSVVEAARKVFGERADILALLDRFRLEWLVSNLT